MGKRAFAINNAGYASSLDFAGTIAFPTAHALMEEIGWRGVVLVFAGLIGFISAPLNFYAVSQAQTANPAPPDYHPPLNTGRAFNPATLRIFVLLGFGNRCNGL